MSGCHRLNIVDDSYDIEPIIFTVILNDKYLLKKTKDDYLICVKRNRPTKETYDEYIC